ncbi:CXADR-like membrane protein [Pelobates fuscus]|uniref:CXADR-like membrane protein n=1 Tax=Pelobates fuscus TaxID=191477 RepID=UPI002FE44AE0
MPSFLISFLGLCYVLGVLAQTEITRVAEENVTLPCQHRLGLLGEQSLDIEWLLNHSEQRKSVLISYSAGRIYEGENARGRYSFASNFLAGDAAILITSLQPSDAGQYICKVKNAGQYEWNHIKLKVLVKPSEPECQIDGELLAGKSITLLCNTSAGTAPISYRWQRMKYREDVTVAMPKTARIDNPQRLMLQNLTIADNGSYLCVVSNDAGRRSCSLHLIIKSDTINVGFLAGVTCGAVASVILVCIALWLLFRKKELKKREEDEFLNEIREDAEAPKARLVKPGSSSSGSRSSRSGSSSTRSTTNSASRSQRTLSTQETAPGEPRHHCLDQI